ncbi:hypothetical protein CUMW_053180, partial [Citrus unshiu]
MGLIPNVQPEDKELSNYRLDTGATTETKRAQNIKHFLENHQTAKILLFLLIILGTSMVSGDGILTPCISVLSAVGGIKALGQAILILLFYVQRFGTDKVGASFALIILVWFPFLFMIGLYDLFKYDATALRALNPWYIMKYFIRNGKNAWISLGGVVMCITSPEAMFVDLGHFSVCSIQISFSGIHYSQIIVAKCRHLRLDEPSVAAWLVALCQPGDVSDTFYFTILSPMYWPTFVIAVLAAIIASQAMISGAFAIIAQSLSLGCFPRVKVYIPEINYLIMICCVIVTVIFKNTEHISNAYGIAVVAVMVITTLMVTLIMLVVWKTKIWWIKTFFVVFAFIELMSFTSVLYKFVQGGYLPIAFSLFVMIIMGIWHYVHKQRFVYELNNKISSDYVSYLVANPDVNRVPGMGLLYSELVQGISPIFSHFIANIPSIHSVLVFVSIKSFPICKVILEERCLFRRVEPRDLRMYRCVVRYGYKDKIEESDEFERQLVENLKDFIWHEHLMSATAEQLRSGGSGDLGAQEEIQFVQRAKDKGVVYLLGVAKPNSSMFKKIVVNYAHSFLRKNFRQGERFLAIPRSRVLRVGMTYET